MGRPRADAPVPHALPLRPVLLLLILALPRPATPTEVDELLACHENAVGGLAAWRAVETLRIVGTVRVGQVATPLELEIRRESDAGPARIRMETEIQGLPSVRTWDGRSGTVRTEALGHLEPVPMHPDEARAAARAADVEGPLLDATAKGRRVHLGDREDLDGAPVVELVVTSADGERRSSLLDPATCLEVARVERVDAGGATVTLTTRFSEHRGVDALVVPHRHVTTVEGAPTPQPARVFEVDEVVIDGAAPSPRRDRGG